MALFRGIQYREFVPGSPRESWSHYGSKVVRVLDVYWRDRWNFVREILGYPVLQNSTFQLTESRFLSRAIPKRDGSYTSVGGDFETEGKGEPGLPGALSSGGTMYSSGDTYKLNAGGTMFSSPSVGTMVSSTPSGSGGAITSIITVAGCDPWIHRVIPAAYISPDSERYLFATSVTSVEGIGLPEPLSPTAPRIIKDSVLDVTEYALARVTVEFTPLTYFVMADEFCQRDDCGNPSETGLNRYVTIKYRPVTEMLTLGRSFAKYVDDGTPANRGSLPFGIPMREAKVGVSITWHQVPILPKPAISSLGKVNSNTMNIALVNDTTTPALEAWPGTLLYIGMEPMPLARGIVQAQLYDLTYHFIYFNPAPGVGHNFIFDQAPTQFKYRLVSSDGTTSGTRIFQAANLSRLFVPLAAD